MIGCCRSREQCSPLGMDQLETIVPVPKKLSKVLLFGMPQRIESLTISTGHIQRFYVVCQVSLICCCANAVEQKVHCLYLINSFSETRFGLDKF